MKAVACGKFRRHAQNWQKPSDDEKRISWPVLGQNKNFRNPVVSLLLLSFLSIFGLSIFFWDSLTFSFYFVDIFSSLRSTKEVTKENMSLNKWKAWPVENSKDVLKIGKKLMTTKRGSRDQFLAKIKFFEPGCFTFAPLFFIYFWSINIFLGFFDFFLLFLWYFFFT